MGTPDDLAEFVRFEAEDLTVYVSRKVLGTLKAGRDRMPFYIDGHGRFMLEFEEPWNPGRES